MQELAGLGGDLWDREPGGATGLGYWLGWYGGGLGEWHHQLRSSTPQTGAVSATGRAGLQPGGSAACPTPGQVNTSRGNELIENYVY